MRRVRRLALLDGLAAALVFLLVGSLGMAAGSPWITKAYAAKWSYDTCQAPATCPGTSGTCTGCAGPGQTGVCTSSSIYWGCSGVPAYCSGLDPTFAPCNCSTNAC